MDRAEDILAVHRAPPMPTILGDRRIIPQQEILVPAQPGAWTPGFVRQVGSEPVDIPPDPQPVDFQLGPPCPHHDRRHPVGLRGVGLQEIEPMLVRRLQKIAAAPEDGERDLCFQYPGGPLVKKLFVFSTQSAL